MVSSLKVKEDFMFSLSLLLKFSRVLSHSHLRKMLCDVWVFLCCCSRNLTVQIVVVVDRGRARNRDDDNKCDQW